MAEALSCCKDQLDMLEEEPTMVNSDLGTTETTQDDVFDIIQLTDVELWNLASKNPELVLAPLCQYCGLGSFLDLIENPEKKPTVDYKQLNPMLIENECKHLYAQEEIVPEMSTPRFVQEMSTPRFKYESTSTGCLYFEILCRLLFDSKRPELVLLLIEMMDKKKAERLTNYKQELASRALDWLNNVYLDSELEFFSDIRTSWDKSSTHYTTQQLRVIATLMHWSGNLVGAVKLYLSRKLHNDVIALIKEYSLENTQKYGASIATYELFHLLLKYCVQNNELEDIGVIWDTLSKILPPNYNVFDFISLLKKKKKDTCNKMFAEDKVHLELKTVLPSFQKFCTQMKF